MLATHRFIVNGEAERLDRLNHLEGTPFDENAGWGEEVSKEVWMCSTVVL